MRHLLWGLLILWGCDDAGSPITPANTVDRGGSGGTGGMTGEGGFGGIVEDAGGVPGDGSADGAAGQGGVGGQGGGAAGEGGAGGGGSAGGVGGAGGAGEGGAGGVDGAGGVGGAGGGAGGAGGAGGVGGAGGLAGCPADLFACERVCADLLGDPEHCGSCGTRCADQWPADLRDRGWTPQTAQIAPACVEADCVFQCAADPQIRAVDLLDNSENCGACGRVCDAAVDNLVGNTCVEGQCHCLLADADGVYLGDSCDGFCVLSGYPNCRDGCCPSLNEEAVMIPHRPGWGQQHYTFDLETPSRVALELEGENGCGVSQLLWIRYLDDGGLAFIAGQRGCDALIRPFLPPGRYGVLVTVNLPGVRLTRRVEPVRPDFQAPGTDISGGVSNVVHTVFEVVERRAYTLNIMVERAGLCDGMPQGLLLGVHHDFAEVIEVGALCRDNPPDSRWMGVLAPGVYVALIESVWLAGGTYRFTVSR